MGLVGCGRVLTTYLCHAPLTLTPNPSLSVNEVEEPGVDNCRQCYESLGRVGDCVEVFPRKRIVPLCWGCDGMALKLWPHKVNF